MRLDVCKPLVACALLWFAAPAFALSIAFAPASPAAGTAVSAVLTQPFNCAVMPPQLKAVGAGSLTLESIAPDGVVHCPFIPIPEPTTSTYTVDLGALSQGTYAVTWNVYLYHQETGERELLSSQSASLVVAPGGGGPPPVTIPALSTWALLSLAGLCGVFGMRRLQRASAQRRTLPARDI